MVQTVISIWLFPFENWKQWQLSRKVSSNILNKWRLNVSSPLTHLTNNKPSTSSSNKNSVSLQDYLMEIQRNPEKSKFCKLRLLCRSLAGNNVYYLTVTAPTDEETAKVSTKFVRGIHHNVGTVYGIYVPIYSLSPHDLILVLMPNVSFLSKQKKRAIVVSSRVHPGETPASWMMKGLMDFITSDSFVVRDKLITHHHHHSAKLFLTLCISYPQNRRRKNFVTNSFSSWYQCSIQTVLSLAIHEAH